MNWLNRLDDVLDKALTPQNSRHGNSPSATRCQLSESADHVAEKFGNESDSSHGSPVILPSRSLEVVGPSIPGRVRRRSEGIAIPAPGNQTKPAISNLSRPVIPGKLKRNRSKEVAEKQTQYPGNVKRITIPKNRAEEDQQSSESEVELPSSEVLPLASQRSRNEMEYQHSENVRLSNEAFDELNKVQTIVSGEMAPVENQALAKTVHDEKQRGPEQMQQVTDNKASDKLLQTDQSSTQISASKVVESIGSLAKTKAWGFLQVNSFDRTSRENEVLINNLETCSAEASELRINEHSDSVKVGPPFTSDAIETIIVPKTKSDKGREPLSRNENRGENGGIAVALFSDERHEMRLEPSQKDIVGPSDVEKIREANKLSSLPSRNCEQFQSAVDNAEKAVQGSLVLTQEAGETANDLSAGESASKHLDQAENDPPVRNSGHLHLSAAAVTPQSEPMADDKVPAFKVVDGAHERLIKEQGKQSIKETSVREFSQSHVLPNDEPSARVRNYPKHGHPGNGELLALPKSQDNSFEAPGFVDSSSIAKVPSAWNGSVNASERGIDSPHMSASLTKTDPDVDSTVSMWSSFKLDMPFDRSRNCHGMVNLRLVRARRLSCSTGSFVQGNISLKPWKGKVRTTTTRTYAGSRGHGVCAVWDDCEENHVSMIHSFSSDESPIPTIEIDLTVSPLGMGLLGFSMGTLSLSCEELFMNPSRTRRYWLTTPETKTIPSPVRLASPMLQVEAMFEPTIVEEETTDEDKNVPPDIIDIPKDVLTFQRANSSGLEEYPSTPVRLGSTGGARADDNACSTPLSDRTPPFSAKSQRSLHSQTNQHLLCLKKFRLPATCCVCKKSIMSGIRSQAAYRCEKCGIDCCEDCVLQVDIRMPCGSLLAQDVAKNSIQNKLSMNTILSTVAPVSGNVTSPQRDTHPSSHCVSLNESKGIGTIDLVFLRAFVLDEPWSPESDAADILTSGKTSFKAGDYYMRITRVGSKDSARTQTIQNSSKPVFDSKEMILNVPHYGSEFRIDLVDALTDKPVGSSFLTTQSLLQLQRDDVFGQSPFRIFSYFRSNRRVSQKLQLRIDLRHDMKDATTFEFFSPPNPSPHSSKVQRGDIVAYTDILIEMKENLTNLYGDDPYECPFRPPDELNMRLFQLHLTRLSSLVETVKDAVNGYIYIISWKNPIVTALSLFISLQICAAFNPAFIGSLPCFCLIVFMVTSALRHVCFQNQRDLYVRKEIEKRRKEENIVLEHAIHRPVGEIGIAISAGRNINSLEFGIPGSVMCRAFWNPAGLMSSSEREKKDDRPVVHEIGSTDRVYSTNPVWKEAKESSLTKRLRSIKHFNRENAERIGSVDSPQFIFPVLQPFNTPDTGLPVLEPWENSLGTVDVEVGFTDVISILPDSESTAGVISIPFVDLYKQKVIKGWFKPRQAGRESAACKPLSDDDGTPQVLLEIWWTPPVDNDDNGIDIESDTRREESVFIQEEMLRSTIIQGESRRGVIGSSLGAISSVRGLTGHLAMVQNTLGQVLDTVEAICNALTFTDPLKSTILLGIAVCLWIFFSLVSVKVIFYAMVMGQYGATFIGRFGSLLSEKSETVRKNKKNPSPFGILVTNAFRGIPTFEDLRRTYFWESLRRGVREAEQFSEEKRGKRLKMLFRARWYSSIQILSSSGDHWRTCFAIIQGHRFTWWSSVNDFDEGCKPLGSIFLSGHSGLATPSPLELKQISSENLDRLVCLFGRGIDKQERLSLLTPSSAGKDELELAINHTINHKTE